MTPTLNLADELLALAWRASSDRWVWTKFSNKHGHRLRSIDEVAETVAFSVRQSEIIELWGVSLEKEAEDGRAKAVCYTGNGPHSADNSAYIAACNPTNITALCNAVKELSEENARLRAIIERGLKYGFANGGNWNAMKNVTADEARAALAAGEKT